MRIKDLDKLNLAKLNNGGLLLGSIFAIAEADSKYDAHFKNDQKWLKSNHLA